MTVRVDKQLPFDQDAEYATIGSLLIDGDVMNELSFLQSGDFFIEQNQYVYSAIEQLFNRGDAIDQITVAKELIAMQKLDDVGGVAYLSQLVCIVPTSLHAKHYGRIVKNTAVRRRLISVAGQIENLAYSEQDPYKCMAKSDEMILRIQGDLSMPHVLTPYQLADKGTVRYPELQDTSRKVSISTGYYDLDQFTGGLFPSEYYILAARPGIGKSQIALQIAMAAGKRGPVLIFPLEMSWQSMLDRIVAQTLPTPKPPHQIPLLQKIRRGGYSDSFLDDIMAVSLPAVSESNIYLMSLQNDFIETPQFTLAMINSMCRHVKMAYGLKLVIIDYISLIDSPASDQRKSRAEQVGAVSKGIKHLCASIEVPVLALAQINREPEKRDGRRPRLENLRESGSLEADADAVFLMYRDMTGEDDTEDAELIIAKQRQGQSGITLKMHWDAIRGRYDCFEE